MMKNENPHKKIYDIISKYHNQDGFTTITAEELGKRTENVDESLKKEARNVVQKEMGNK